MTLQLWCVDARTVNAQEPAAPVQFTFNTIISFHLAHIPIGAEAINVVKSTMCKNRMDHTSCSEFESLLSLD